MLTEERKLRKKRKKEDARRYLFLFFHHPAAYERGDPRKKRGSPSFYAYLLRGEEK